MTWLKYYYLGRKISTFVLYQCYRKWLSPGDSVLKLAIYNVIVGRDPHKYCIGPRCWDRLWGLGRASVKPMYGVNYVLKSPRYTENQYQRHATNFQLSALYPENQPVWYPIQWKNPTQMSVLPAYLWHNCVCPCVTTFLSVCNWLVLEAPLSKSSRCQMSDRACSNDIP